MAKSFFDYTPEVIALQRSIRRSLLALTVVLAAITAATLPRPAKPAGKLQTCNKYRPTNLHFAAATVLWVVGNKWHFNFHLSFQAEDLSPVHVKLYGFAGTWEGDLTPQSDGSVDSWLFTDPPTYWDTSYRDHWEYAEITTGACFYGYGNVDSLSWYLTELPIYIASLGDSYSSGEGNPPFDINQKCHTSKKAWPGQLGNSHYRLDTWQKIFACSGATIDDLTSTYRGQPPQLERLAILAQDSPLDYVTLTIGGNDAGFGTVVRDCFLPRHDCVRDGTVLAAMQRVKQLGAKLTSLYRAVKSDVQPWTKVLVPLYPQIFPNSGTVNCSWLSPLEQAAINAATKQLDAVIEKAALAAGADFVDTRRVLAGHELCTEDSWLNPVGRTPIAYDAHPNESGQLAIAALVRSYVLAHLDYRSSP